MEKIIVLQPNTTIKDLADKGIKDFKEAKPILDLMKARLDGKWKWLDED